MGANEPQPERQTEYQVAKRMRVKRFLQAVLPTFMELCGVSVIIGCLWIIEPIAAILVFGVFLVLVAQVLPSRRGNQ